MTKDDGPAVTLCLNCNHPVLWNKQSGGFAHIRRIETPGGIAPFKGSITNQCQVEQCRCAHPVA